MAPRERRSERKQRDPDLGVLAARVLFSIQDELFARLAEEGHPDIRPRHGAVLSVIDRDGTRATDLARFSGRHKQVIGVLVDELVELGYVERQPDPADRRAKLIVPTARGLDEIDRSDAIVKAIEARHARRLGRAEYAQFKTLMGDVARQQQTRAQALTASPAATGYGTPGGDRPRGRSDGRGVRS